MKPQGPEDPFREPGNESVQPLTEDQDYKLRLLNERITWQEHRKLQADENARQGLITDQEREDEIDKANMSIQTDEQLRNEILAEQEHYRKFGRRVLKLFGRDRGN